MCKEKSPPDAPAEEDAEENPQLIQPPAPTAPDFVQTQDNEALDIVGDKVWRFVAMIAGQRRLRAGGFGVLTYNT